MNIFSYIKSRISIFDVVSEYTTLKKAGSYFKAPCPFHHEKTASFTVSPHKEIFYCFGCHAGGDVIAFIEKSEQCSALEAAKYLAERYSIELPSDLTIESSHDSQERKNRYYELCRYVATWCHENIKKHSSVRSYLKQRGFEAASIDQFNIGYFPGGLASIKAFMYEMKNYNLLPHDLIEANVLSEGKTVVYSPFEERIIFPIKDHLGRFCGFGGRTFKPHDERPKYYNSRENEYFTKGSLLFGLDKAKTSIQESGNVFLVEGYTDCIAMAQHGHSNTIATLGTACTPQHLKQLSRYANKLYILYDNDHAGQQAILRLTQLCWQANIELNVINLPTGHDPASFLAQGNDLQNSIADAQDIFIFFIESIGKNFADQPLSTKVNQARNFINIIQTIDDPLKQDILLQKASNTFAIPFQALKQELDRTKKSTLNSDTVNTNKEDQKPPIYGATSIPKLEKKIFCAIMNNIQIFNNRNAKYIVEYMPGPLRDILEQLKTHKNSNNSVDFSLFFDKLDQKNKEYISKLLLEHDDSIDEKEFEQLLLQFQKKQWKLIVHTIKAKLALAKNEANEAKVQQILQDFLEFKQKILPNIAHDQTQD